MATYETPTVETQDVMGVRSRVSWGAIFAGAVVALAVYLLISALGVAVGLSVTGQVGDQEMRVGAIVWAIVTTFFALFLGGWVASQCTAGENKQEAMAYGVLVWGVVFALLLWLMASGIRLGFNAVMGMASIQATTAGARYTDAQLQAAGFTPEEITAMRARFDRLTAPAPGTATEVRVGVDDARAAAWWTFGGILLSMLAAIGGSVLGSGPNLMLTGFGFRATTFGLRSTAREPVGR